MEVDISPSTVGIVLALMAAASLLAMISLNQINYIVHGDLYTFGLQFSYIWAIPYWVSSGVVFGLSWINIALSVVIAMYFFKRSRKEEPVSAESVRVN